MWKWSDSTDWSECSDSPVGGSQTMMMCTCPSSGSPKADNLCIIGDLANSIRVILRFGPHYCDEKCIFSRNWWYLEHLLKPWKCRKLWLSVFRGSLIHICIRTLLGDISKIYDDAGNRTMSISGDTSGIIVSTIDVTLENLHVKCVCFVEMTVCGYRT